MIMGIVAVLLFQIAVNVGMVVGLMPVTGIPLPLLSYGGSSDAVHVSGAGHRDERPDAPVRELTGEAVAHPSGACRSFSAIL